MSLEVLNEFSKAEIIEWLRRNLSWCLRSPKKSDLLYVRWRLKSEALRLKREASHAVLKGIDVKKIAAEFNAAESFEERERLFKLLKPYDAAFSEWGKNERALTREGRRLDRLYLEIEEARRMDEKQNR